MLQRNPNRTDRVGIITVSVIAGAAAIAAIVAVGLATADDEPSRSARTAALVDAAAGSDVHLENLAADIAQRRTAALVDAAAGSDVHLENLAADIAQRRTAALVEE